jgi:predicted TIM-barrel fold metal-dependent hydrolase
VNRIDMHAHVFPPAFLVESEARGGFGWPGPLPAVEECLASMEAYGIRASVVSLPIWLDFGGALEPAQVRALARACNEYYAELVSRTPEKLAALAVLPLPDVDAGLEELAYALDELRLDGVILLARYGGRYLGDSMYDPLFEELQRRGAYVFVHPTPGDDPLEQYFSTFLLELPFATTRAVMNLLFSGTLARSPDVRMQFAHMGGAAPYLAPRVVEVLARYPQAAEAAPDGLDHLKRLYWDTGLSTGSEPIRAALELTGLDHLVFGTDWPFDIARPQEGADPAPGLAFLGEDRTHIEQQSPLALVPRLAA